MKEQRIMADPMKFSASLLTFLVMIFLIWNAFSLGHIITGIIFVLIAAIFLYIMFLYGTVLRISNDCIRSEFLFIPLITLTRDQIGEIGVVGTKVFNGTRKNKKPGRRYIYISPEVLDNDSRFKMALEWPPRNGTLFCIYSRQHIDAIQFFWRNPIAQFNAGDIFVNSIE